MKMNEWMMRLCCVLACGMLPSLAHAQVTRLDGRVSETVRTQVRAIADSLAQNGLPVNPVVDKALEGTSKRASDQRIVDAVRKVAADLRTAQRALGTATADEVATGAAAIRAGVPALVLADMRRALGTRSLVVPLSVLSELVVRGMPVAEAQVAIVERARIDDQRVLAFGREVWRVKSSGSSLPSGALGAPAEPLSQDHPIRTGTGPKPKRKP